MWAYETTFYQIYPLGFCGAPRENTAPVAEDELAQAAGTAPNPDAPIMKIAQWADYLQELGVALWDVIESCDIKGSSDASIKNVVPARVELITSNTSIEQVICNGGTAGRLYKRYLQERTGLPAVVLPSTSPANAAWRLERLVERWGSATTWTL